MTYFYFEYRGAHGFLLCHIQGHVFLFYLYFICTISLYYTSKV